MINYRKYSVLIDMQMYLLIYYFNIFFKKHKQKYINIIHLISLYTIIIIVLITISLTLYSVKLIYNYDIISFNQNGILNILDII